MDALFKKLEEGYLSDTYGWCVFYYGVLSKVINENNFKNCVEVGIGYGFHARQVLENTNIEKLTLVDPSKWYPNDGFAEDVMKNGGFDDLVLNIKRMLTPWENRYTWLRKCSTEVTEEEIPEESVDVVFVDADHSYEAVKADLEFWWKKVRKGGQLLGDDYSSCHPGTTKAVDEFAINNNLKIDFLKRENSIDPNYVIYRFIKE
jgi:hypothetical protein